MAYNPECGLDCVSAGAVRLDNTPSADQQTGRHHLSGDQSAEQAKHTPGPWRHELVQSLMGHGYARWQWNITGRGGAIAEIYAKLGRTADCPEEANARLIAAAPEMLEALKAVMSDTVTVETIDQVKAAISKAEGRDR